MQRGAQGGRFAFVGGRGALGKTIGGGATHPALALRNMNNKTATAAYSSGSGSKEDRDWFDWSKYRTTSSKYDPFYQHITTDARFGMSDVWTQGMDPPQPIFPVDVKGRSKAYLPEVLSRKHYYTKYAMLNRPQQLHALNLATIRHLTPKWQAHKETTRAIVLTSSTPEHLSSGTDFVDLLQAVRSGNQEFPKTYFKELYQLIYYINSLDKPFLPIMNGVTMGSGASLGYSSNSFKITTEQTVFALPEVGMGFFPDAGASYLLPRLADHVGTFLALTGKRIRGWDVLWSGIATHLVPSDRIHIMYDQLDQLRDKFHSFDQIIHCVHSSAADKIEHPYLLKEKGYLDIIKRCFSQPTVPEIMKALSHEKHPWAKQVLQRLQEQCPLSLAVTLRSLQEGATKDMGAALRREYRIALRFMLSRDFAEGVTARIVEKRQPNWTHKSVEDVHPDEVQAFFESLREDELDIRSLDEERAEDSAIQQLLDKQRRFKKMMRRPWVQNEAKQYLAQELKSVQKELEARQSQTAGQLAAETEKQREEYQKKIEEGRARKGEALSFLQQLEDELVRRRNVEKEAVTKTTVDKLEWKRWEEDIKNVREAKGILTLDVNTEYDEQLPTAALQTVLVDGIAEALSGTEDLAKQVSLVAASLDTAGKSALELKEHLFRRTPEGVAEAEAEYERQYVEALQQDELRRTLREQMADIDIDAIRQAMNEDLGLLQPDERDQLDTLLSSTEIVSHARQLHKQKQREQQQQQQQRPEAEAGATVEPALTLDDIAKLVLGGDHNDDAARVAETRAKIESGELAVSEETYAAAVQLMRERSLAAAEPSERATVEATFDTMHDEIVNVVKAKVAGQSREQMVNALVGGEQGKSKLAQLMTQTAANLPHDSRVALTDPENQALILAEFQDFAKNLDCTPNASEGKVPLWKLEDKIANALARRDTEAAWPAEKRQELSRQIAQDRQLRDLHAFPGLRGDDDDGADALQQATGQPGSSSSSEDLDLGKLVDDAAYELEHGRPAPIPVKLMTEQQKDEFERNQSDMGLANYGKQFVYEKYADRIGHFKRIKERQDEFMSQVPDPISEPEQYRDWLVAVRLADLAMPALEDALGNWIDQQAKAGYNVKPIPEALRDDSVDGFVGTGSDDLEEVPTPTPAIFKLWKMATSPSAESDETDAPVPPVRRTDDASSQELLRSIKKSATASKSSSSPSSGSPSSSSSSTTPQ
ncbi:enoylCoA hydratase/isomerase family domain containing protein [Acanthamoeba castellanii str. Neff]|uniref:EnoylCoA hydratase/isomerase family domain containing protein n=1 Tax=Acanthamoeba castellanii (strain ATCC 30010 / Neff) TaxID=1257118 RepID=L8H7T2_ACACF|nr:enoylCoA hydratase/isomerase family domain containing protein [Acanthamoeba castellanii str. Neff]ELR21302.1 enoylCoA hydratase/isomerase family domain containing protein [Acanthamoeba castellanii str. Neff]